MVDAAHKQYSLITLEDGLIGAYMDSPTIDTLSPQHLQAFEKRELIPCYYHPFQTPHLEPEHLADYLRKPTLIKGATKNFYTVFGEGFIQIGPNDATYWDYPE